MNLKELFLGVSFKKELEKIVEGVVQGVIYPAAEEYVKKTTNKWDDSALVFLKEFLNDLINDIAKDDGD